MGQHHVNRLAVGSKERARVQRDMKRDYKAGASIRALAGATGRSYGAVHRLLIESGVTLRSRGGQPQPTTKKRK